MNNFEPIYTEAVLALMARPEEFVPASAIAPIVKMHPSVIIEYAKQGKWPHCEVVFSGDHVKFARIDFLKHFGFIRDEEPEAEEAPTVADLITTLADSLIAILKSQQVTMEIMKEQNELLRQILEKSA